MATMSTLDNSIVTRALRAINTLHSLIPELNDLNVLIDAGDGLKARLTADAALRASLESDPSLQGLTTQMFEDGAFVLTATVRNALVSAQTQLIECAARVR